MSEQRYTWIPDPWANDFVPSRTVNVPIAWLPRRGDGSYDFVVVKRNDRDSAHWSGSYIPTVKTYRDDLRGGWHCVPEGARYIAIQGSRAGQRGYTFTREADAVRAAEEWNAHFEPPRFGVREMDRPEAWCVLRLDDLADHRITPLQYRPAASPTRDKAEHKWSPMVLGSGHGCRCGHEVTWAFFAAVEIPSLMADTTTFKPECREALVAYVMASRANEKQEGYSAAEVRRQRDTSSPRFTVKSAAEMREGEPCWDIGLDHHRSSFDAAASRMNSGQATGDASEKSSLRWKATAVAKVGYTLAIIDTHGPEWQAFDREHRKPTGTTMWNCVATQDPIMEKIMGASHHWSHDPDSDRYSCMCGVTCRNPPRGLTQTACQIAWDLYAERALPKATRPGIPNRTCGDLDCGEMGPKGDRCAHRYNHAGRCLWVGEGQHPEWKAAPLEPTDAEIVEAWDARIRHHELQPIPAFSPTAPLIMRWSGGMFEVQRSRYQAARSRELKRKQDEAREAERMRVVCEGTLSEDW